MKVSIITVVYNGEGFIESAINSVLSQDYPNIEYIVVDGQSKDGTMKIVKSYEGKIAKLISEKDNGIYDAMNKGLSLATGDLIGILNADDFYKSNSIIRKVVQKVKADEVDLLYGDLVYVDAKKPKMIKRIWKSGPYKRNNFLWGWMPPHPTFFAKSKVYEKYGQFNTKLKSAADYEFMLRVLYKYKLSVSYIPEIVTVMREGGESNATLKNRLQGNKEDALAWKINGLKPYPFTRLLKPLRKIPQFVYRLSFNSKLDEK